MGIPATLSIGTTGDSISELWCWLSRCGGGDFQAGLGPGPEPNRVFRRLVRRGALLAAPAKGPAAPSDYAREKREPLPMEGGDAVTARCCGEASAVAPAAAAPHPPAAAAGPGGAGGTAHPGMGRAGQRAAAPGASAVGRSDKGFQEREWQAAAQPSAGCGRVGAAGTSGEQTRQLPQGHGGLQEGGGGSSCQKEGALPCRWPLPRRWLRGGEAGEEPGSSPGGRRPLHCANLQAGWRRQPRPASAAGAAPPLASVPGRAAGSRFPLRRSWTAASWRPGQQAAASWSVFFPECPFISPSPLLSRTCSLSFSLHSYLISACLPLL